jgi:D-alanine-D-alanine ligase
MNPRRVLVLHSDVAPDAPPDELDTLYQAEAIEMALAERGHVAVRAPFVHDEAALAQLIRHHAPDVVFNLVEAVGGSGLLAVGVPGMLGRIGVAYTGADERALTVTGDKPRAKRALRNAGLPTSDWWVSPDFEGADNGARLIVKSALEDCSLGLDDASVVRGAEAARSRAEFCAQKFGGRWFAESYIEGREFNIAVLQNGNDPYVLPLAEMTFQEWQPGRPRIVGYKAKWDDDSFESTRTVRAFGLENENPVLATWISELAAEAWNLFALTGYARVDFRVNEWNEPMILEINPNPCLSPDAGFAAAAERAGLSYPELIERIVAAAQT